MATIDKQSLKQKFRDGAKPTGTDFADLIDTIQSGAPSESAPPLPVSNSVAEEGTDTTGLVSPAGVKAQIDSRLVTQAEAQAGRDNTKLMTPLRTREAINLQVPLLITTATNRILGGISSAYNTLQKLYTYITNSFYNRSQSDARYDRRTDRISGSRIVRGVNAGVITEGTLSNDRLSNITNTQIATNADIASHKLALDYVNAADFRYNGNVVTNLKHPFVESPPPTNPLGGPSDGIPQVRTTRFPVYLTHIGLEFLKRKSNGDYEVIDEFDQLAYRVYSHFFTGGDGSKLGGFSGDFIKFQNAYSVFTGLRDSTPIQGGLIRIPAETGNVLFLGGSSHNTTPSSADTSFLGRKAAISLLNILNYGINFNQEGYE